jgi:hypothetical protein
MRHSQDPRWIILRFSGSCARCSAPIERNQRAFYYPIGRTLLCAADSCGGQASRDFAAACFDEEGAR